MCGILKRKSTNDHERSVFHHIRYEIFHVYFTYCVRPECSKILEYLGFHVVFALQNTPCRNLGTCIGLF